MDGEGLEGKELRGMEKETKDRLQKSIEQSIEEAEERLAAALEEEDVDNIWKIRSNAAEKRMASSHLNI